MTAIPALCGVNSSIESVDPRDIGQIESRLDGTAQGRLLSRESDSDRPSSQTNGCRTHMPPAVTDSRMLGNFLQDGVPRARSLRIVIRNRDLMFATDSPRLVDSVSTLLDSAHDHQC